MGLTCIGLSLRYRSPVLTAWSTPGAALLSTALIGVPMNEAIGAFIVASTLITLCGFTGWVETLMKHIPKSLAAGMLGATVASLNCAALLRQEKRLERLAAADLNPLTPRVAPFQVSDGLERVCVVGDRMELLQAIHKPLIMIVNLLETHVDTGLERHVSP